MPYDPIVTLPPDLEISDDIQGLSAETWHLPRSTWRPIRQKYRGKGVKVAVLDTGCNEHPTLRKPLVMRSFISGQSALDPTSGHGTHCAGTVSSSDEDIGVAPDVDLIIGKVLSNQGSGSSSGIAAGVEWAIEQGADVISMSLGGGSSYAPTNNAIRKAHSRGIVVCIAAGNSGFNGSTNTVGWPARSGEGVCVAALKQDFKPASFSSGGVQVVVASPGQQILSCDNRGSGFRFMSGTSMACPFTAGCFALFLSAMRAQGDPSWTSIQAVNAFIKANATDLLKPGHDHATGYGMFSMVEVMDRLAKDTLTYV